MERRISKVRKISNQYEEIVEEKLSVEENLNTVITRISSYVDHVKKSHEDMKQSDISEVLKYELDVLTKLIDINSELEKLLEEFPFENKTESTNHVLERQSESSKSVPANPSNITNPYPICEAKKGSGISEGTVSNECSTNNTVKKEILTKTDNITENEIENIRASLKHFSLKLGLNKENSLDEHCKKPTISSCAKNIPSVSSTSNIIPDCISESDGEENLDIFEVPERDTSIPINPATNCDRGQNQLETLIENCLKSSVDLLDTNRISAQFVSDFVSKNEVISSCEDSTETDCITSCSSDKFLNEFLDCQNDNTKKSPDLAPPSPFEYERIYDSSSSSTSYEEPEKEEILNNHKTDGLSNNVSMFSNNSIIKNVMSPKNTSEKQINSYQLQPKKTPVVGDECMFSHIISPSEFYVHIVDEETASIDNLMKGLNKKYTGTISAYSNKESACMEIGRFCSAFVPSYKSWYRAEVLNWFLEVDSDDISVQLVDYGRKVTVSYTNVRKMNQEFIHTRKLAVRCHFPLMYPPDSTLFHKTTDWPEATIDALMGVSGLSDDEATQNTLFKIVYANFESNSLAIDLYSPSEGDEEHTVGQILLDLGLAKQIVDEYDEDNEDLGIFLQDLDELEAAENINEAITGYDARDEVRICRFTRADGSCFKGKHCKLDHVPHSKDGFTLDKEHIFNEAMYNLCLPSVGESIPVLVTCYINTCRFYIHIVRNAVREPKYIIDRDLYSLSTDMNSPKLEKTYESFKILPAIGEIVLAKHWTKKWLRAVVRQLIRNGDGDTFDIQVFTVDVGETMNVKLCDVRKIKPDLLRLPFQAVECYIHNYKMRDDCCQEKARAFFDNNLYLRNFSAQILSPSLPLKISLRSLNGLIDIGQQLMLHNFAEVCTYDNNPSNDCCLTFS